MTIPHPQLPQNYATIGQRIGAYFVDGILYSVVFVVTMVGGMTMILTSYMSEAVLYLTLLFAYGTPLFYTVFVIYLAGAKGYTPGKKIVGIRMVDEATHRPVGFWRAFLRNLVLGLISSLTCGIGLIIVVVLASDHPRRQGWHDRAAKTVVVPAGAMGFSPPPVPVAPPTGVPKTSLPEQAGENGPPPPPPVSAAGPPPPPPVTPMSQVPSAVPPPMSQPPVPRPPSVPPIPGLVGPPPGIESSVPSAPPVLPPAAPPVLPPAAPPAPSTVGNSVDTPIVTTPPPAADESTQMAARKISTTQTWSLVPQLGAEQIVSGDVLVGRDPDVSLVAGATAWSVDDAEKTVSKTHALVRLTEGQLWIEDWNSTNGVLVRRGEQAIELKAREGFLLEPQDIILLGDFEVKVRSIG